MTNLERQTLPGPCEGGVDGVLLGSHHYDGSILTSNVGAECIPKKVGSRKERIERRGLARSVLHVIELERKLEILLTTKGHHTL